MTHPHSVRRPTVDGQPDGSDPPTVRRARALILSGARLFSLFIRHAKPSPKPASPGSALAQIGVAQQRAFVRARAKQLAAELGREWPWS